MKRYRVQVAAPAAAEIEAAYLYIGEQSPERAERWRTGLLKAAESLRRWPKRCRVAPENGPFRWEIRQCIYGNFRLLFTIQRDAVVILHLRHCARDQMDPDEIVPPEQS